MKVLIVFGLLLSFTVNAEDNLSAMIASVQGKVEILAPLTGKEKSTEPQMTFEENRYTFKEAKIGQKVSAGQVILSSTNGKAKIIYAHGDVIIVGPATSIAIPTVKGNEKEMPLNYGKIRGVINKDGPLSGLKIRTPSAVAGVRGTDLFISYNPADVTTEVQVLRGEVEVKARIQITENLSAKTIEAIEAKSYTVKTSEKLIMAVEEPTSPVQTKIDPATNNVIQEEAVPKVNAEVVKATIKDFEMVKQETTIVAKADILTSKEVLVQVEAAEKKAIESIIADVKKYDKKDSDEIKIQNVASVDEANMMVTDKLSEKADKAEASAFKKDQQSIYFGPFNDEFKLGTSWLLIDKLTYEFRVHANLVQRRNFFGTGYGAGGNLIGTEFSQMYIEPNFSIYKRFLYRHAVFAGIGLDFPISPPSVRSNGSQQPPKSSDISVMAKMEIGYEIKFFKSYYFVIHGEIRSPASTSSSVLLNDFENKGGGLLFGYVL